jgi:hypothetical protein
MCQLHLLGVPQGLEDVASGPAGSLTNANAFVEVT